MSSLGVRRPVLATLATIVSSLAFAGSPPITINVNTLFRGPETQSRPGSGFQVQAQQPAPDFVSICPGDPIIFLLGFVNLPEAPGINPGDRVVGTLSFLPLLFQSCAVNPSTTGTCTVLPGGVGISFDLIALASGPDLQGTAALPELAPPCGELVASLHLDQPVTLDLTEATHYLCGDTIPCWNVPVFGRTGALALVALLAVIGALVLVRRLVP